MISRENMSRLHAEQRAGQIAAQIKFLVIYPWLLYHPKCVKAYGKEIQYPVRYRSLSLVFACSFGRIMQGRKPPLTARLNGVACYSENQLEDPNLEQYSVVCLEFCLQKGPLI